MDEEQKTSQPRTSKNPLLARKGSAEPLLRNNPRLELVTDGSRDRFGNESPADAVTPVKADRPAAGLRRPIHRAAAALTELQDETLVGAISWQSGRITRPIPTGSVEED